MWLRDELRRKTVSVRHQHHWKFKVLISANWKDPAYEINEYKMDTSINPRTHWNLFPTWWRHQMETFSALLFICAGNSPLPCKFPTQRPVTRSFDVFFDLRSNKRLSKQWRGWWFETQSCPLWRHRNEGSNEQHASVGAHQTSHYLNRWMYVLLTHITRSRWFLNAKWCFICGNVMIINKIFFELLLHGNIPLHEWLYTCTCVITIIYAYVYNNTIYS